VGREYCTLFDANYLPRGLALYESLRRHESGSRLRVFCMDGATKSILDRFELPDLVPIALEELEEHDPELRAVKDDRTPLEYCWTATPSVALYSLEREPEIDLITYLDADLYFFSSAQPLFDEMDGDAVMIVPHRYAPETAHLEATSGIYNVELVSFRRDEDGLRALRWWRERCLEWCYYRVEDGKLGDQKYLDDWPERFPGVHVLEHVGGGLAPWNVSRYRIHERGGEVMVDDVPLVFYHFHSLKLFRTPSRFVDAARAGTAQISQVLRRRAWSSAYSVEGEELRLIWEPYLASLRRAFQIIRGIEPAFDAGFVDEKDIARRWLRSRAGAAYHRLGAVPGRLVPRRMRPLARAFYWSLHPRMLWRKGRTLRAYGALRRRPIASLGYLLFGRERDNFTYDISNHDELARFLAESLDAPVEQALAYILELEQDDQLRRLLDNKLRSRPDRNRHARYGRRLGWYAAVRIGKPRLIVETGVHDGLGSAVLLSALKRNIADGHPGRLISFDIREDVGWLIDERLREPWELVIGDTREQLPRVLEAREVEMFIHDSDHSHDHETFEFETVAKFARPGAILISDNAHAGTAFAEFCEHRGIQQHFFRERPQRHFYPGAGIGLALFRSAAEVPSTGLDARRTDTALPPRAPAG